MANMTIEKLGKLYLAHLKAEGKSERTIYTYGKDQELVEAFFGKGKELKRILPAHSGKFFKSDPVNKKPNGEPRAKATVEKAIRYYRMMLFWAFRKGYMDKLPLPKDTSLGKSKADGDERNPYRKTNPSVKRFWPRCRQGAARRGR